MGKEELVFHKPPFARKMTLEAFEALAEADSLPICAMVTANIKRVFKVSPDGETEEVLPSVEG